MTEFGGFSPMQATVGRNPDYGEIDATDSDYDREKLQETFLKPTCFSENPILLILSMGCLHWNILGALLLILHLKLFHH